jgi:hypothetical protein
MILPWPLAEVSYGALLGVMLGYVLVPTPLNLSGSLDHWRSVARISRTFSYCFESHWSRFAFTGEQVVVAVALIGALLRATVLRVPPRPISGSHVVITGGSEGIGLAIGLEAVRQGARVTIMARSAGKLEKAVAQLNAKQPSGPGASAISCDVTDAAAVAAAVAKAEALAPIDFLVCGAGAAYPVCSRPCARLQ